MAISETLSLIDGVSGPASSMASAVDGLASAVDGASSSLDSLDSGALDSASSAADEAAASLDDAASAADDAASAADDAASAVEEIGVAAEEASTEAGSLSDTLADVGAAAQGANAALEIAAKIGKAVMKAVELAAAFGKCVIEAKNFNDSATRALDQLTGGRGQAALDGLADAAAALNIPIADAVDQFKALRTAGASNAQATSLIKLRADLEAVGLTADEAEAQVTKTLEAIKGGKGADAAIAATAKAFGAVGDGANAAAKRAFTLEGAIQNIKGVGERSFGTLANMAGPALDRIGAKITSVMDAFEDSGAVAGFGSVLAAGLEAVPGIIDAVVYGFGVFRDAIGPSVEMVSQAFGGLSDALGGADGGMSSAAAIGKVLGAAFHVIAGFVTGAVFAITLFVQAAHAISDVVGVVSGALSGAVAAVSGFVGEMTAAGTNFVMGFVNGVTGAIGAAVSAAADMAGAVTGAVKGALGISSPSKVAQGLAGNFGESFNDTLTDTVDPEIPAPGLSGDAPPAPGGAAGGDNIEIKIYLSGSATNDDAQRVAKAVRKELESVRGRKRSGGKAA